MRTYSKINMNEITNSHHEKLYIRILNFTYNILKTYIPGSNDHIHIGSAVLTSQEPHISYPQITIMNIFLYTLFFDPIFSTCSILSKPVLRDSSRAFLSTRTFFVIIPTLTKFG